MILKPNGFERSLATANDCGGYALVRVVCTSNTGVLTVSTNTGTAYANLTVLGSEVVYVRKNLTDTLTGTGMLGTPISFETS
jgi:hypothetical protein